MTPSPPVHAPETGLVIVDFGLGNVGSVRNMLKRAGIDAMLSAREADLRAATRLILPGVGAFDEGMRRLTESGLRPVIENRVLRDRIPILGICLGMQLMTAGSEEGQSPGLGWLDAATVRFRLPPGERRLRIPHMGWNEVRLRQDSTLLTEIDGERRYYFVHSYHVVCRNPEDVLAMASHGEEFVAAFRHDNIVGVQFHPEKSHRLGMAMLTAFAAL